MLTVKLQKQTQLCDTHHILGLLCEILLLNLPPMSQQRHGQAVNVLRVVRIIHNPRKPHT